MPGAEGPLHLQFIFVYLDILDDVFYSKAETRRYQAVPCCRPYRVGKVLQIFSCGKPVFYLTNTVHHLIVFR
jgi:hypothetical protein